jgi:quercetin dioxygenase-like cupin family protein
VLSGHRDDEPFADTDVPGFRRRELLPTIDPAFDFNMSLLAFDPGVGLDKVEIHDEEHGLYMTAGGGTYLLEDRELEVRAGDFIYMAPYCPQSFIAGDEPSEYLFTRMCGDGFDEAPLNPSSRPLGLRIAPVDTGRTERKRQTRREAGRKARGSVLRWLGRSVC